MTSLERLCHACHLGADRSLCVEQQDGARAVELLGGQSSCQAPLYVFGTLQEDLPQSCGHQPVKHPFSPVKCTLGSFVQMILTILEIFI